MLNLEQHKGLPEALQHHGEFLSPLEWRQVISQLRAWTCCCRIPAAAAAFHPGRIISSCCCSSQKQYDYIVVDLPEVINQATAEFVRNARAVFVVCQPELPSVRLAKLRRAELETCEIPAENVKVLINRWERGQLKVETIEKAADGKVFATLPNDYKEVRNSVLETRLVSSGSSFGKACDALARNICGLPESAHTHPKFTLLRQLGNIGALSR